MKNLKHIFNLYRDTDLKVSVNIFAITTLSLFLFLGCEQDKFVDIDVPSQLSTSEIIFSSTSTANTAIAGLYSLINSFDGNISPDNFQGYTYYFALYADEIRLELDFFGITNIYTNNINSESEVALGMWAPSYRIIQATNRAIEGINASEIPESADKDQLLGEAHFMRAFIHFLLVKIYGGVPYITSSNYEDNTDVSRLPIPEVYAKIVDDLTLAKTLLKDEYIDENRTRANKSTASAILARAYLFQEDWVNAEIESSLVIEDPLYFWETDIENVYLTDSPSTIWQYDVAEVGSNTEHSSTFDFFGEAITPLTDGVLAAFEPDDLRLDVHTSPAVDQAGDVVGSNLYKYKTQFEFGVTTERYKMVRMAELYLIRAEARANQSNILGAQNDINIIRERAGLLPTTANTRETLIDAVMQERRIELLGESGHRWFDLKRTGQADANISTIQEKTGWENPKSLLFPIPRSERLINPNLDQNPGY